MKRQKWAVVIYAGNQDDPAKLDGWYETKEWARAAMKYWCEQYPMRTIALVRSTDVCFPREAA